MTRCMMCGKQIRWSTDWLDWDHVEGGSINCEGKASVATPDESAVRE